MVNAQQESSTTVLNNQSEQSTTLAKMILQRIKHDITDNKTFSPTANVFEYQNCINDNDCNDNHQDNRSIISTTTTTTILPSTFKFECHEGFCRRQNRSFNIDDEQESSTTTSSTTTTTNRNRSGNHMILILIIMAIMFFGMCMAMNLFSRARFKERRGIFSNPRLLKVATHNSSTSSSSQKQEHLDHKKITNSNRKHHRLRLLHDSKFRNKHHYRNSRHNRNNQHDRNRSDDCNDSDQQNDEQQKITTIDMDIDMNVLPSDNHHNM